MRLCGSDLLFWVAIQCSGLLQVLSNKMYKSVVVIVELRRWVNKYQGWHVYLRKYMAHDILNTCNIGDVVKIEQLSHRMSKRKSFNVIEILQRENIVVRSDAPEADPQNSLHDKMLFQNVPIWACLTPAVYEAIMAAKEQFQEDHGVTREAQELANPLMLQDQSYINHEDMLERFRQGGEEEWAAEGVEEAWEEGEEGREGGGGEWEEEREQELGEREDEGEGGGEEEEWEGEGEWEEEREQEVGERGHEGEGGGEKEEWEGEGEWEEEREQEVGERGHEGEGGGEEEEWEEREWEEEREEEVGGEGEEEVGGEGEEEVGGEGEEEGGGKEEGEGGGAQEGGGLQVTEPEKPIND
jgi:ribosomal protein S17